MSSFKTPLAAALIAVAAAPAFAGSPETAVVDPVPVAPAPAPVVDMGGTWTGLFAGLTYGALDVEAGGLDERAGAGGIFAGGDYDLGRFVIGGEAEILGTGMDLGGADIDHLARFKARLGYDLGNTLVYATAGAAQIATEFGAEFGPMGGLGVEYKLTDTFSVGGEYTVHRFDDIDGTGVDADADTLMLRGTYRF